MTRLEQVLQGQEENYILPFFWQHGEEEAVLREYMQAIRGANIRAVCVEARPHPDFAGEKWWRDLDVILDEAKKLGMKVWILDDAHFPSGQAAGRVEEAPDELCKQYLNYHQVEVTGPVGQAQLNVGVMAQYYESPVTPADPFGGRKKRQFDDDTLLAVIASRMDGKEGDISHLDDTLLDLTPLVSDGMLLWDVPAGSWRVFVIYATRKGGGKDNYINFMSKKSCRIQIDAVYEPHYKRYGEEFGRTIAGFFSDEPEIGNMSGYNWDAGIGNPKMPLPWSEEMPALMEERFGPDYLRKVPALWFSVGEPEFTAKIRTGYMDLVTRQCQKNFGEQMGDWCREHGVEYIGHIIEDCSVSTRLGASQGHFFRALRGQDWGGIDNIGAQITFGGENNAHTGFLGAEGDGEFYHHALGKMGASISHIEPRKAGRAMCETFGAYGWGEGTRLMKYIADHLLVRGINRFVPHAFSPKEFPDPDCPPHFYAHGKNPLYKPFGTLMQYTNRISHLIDGGVHVAQAAVLYHAEAEWASMGYMDMVKPARALDDLQIDYDFIPADVFSEREVYGTVLDEKGLHLSRETYRALVVPGAGYVPQPVLEFALEAKKTGFPVYFVTEDGQPGTAAEGMEAVSLSRLASVLRERGICDAVSERKFAGLQVYHYRQEQECYYLISNEHADQVYAGNIFLPVDGVPFRYDAFENRLYAMEYQNSGKGLELSLALRPYEMAVVVIDRENRYHALAAKPKGWSEAAEEITGPWQVSFAENEQYPEFRDEMSMETLENVLLAKPDFSGVIRYEKTVELAEGGALLEFADAYESVEVWCNDAYVGERICPPYRFDLSAGARAGTNRLRVEVRTTLERKVHALTGGMGHFGPEFGVVLPSGLMGAAVLRRPAGTAEGAE